MFHAGEFPFRGSARFVLRRSRGGGLHRRPAHCLESEGHCRGGAFSESVGLCVYVCVCVLRLRLYCHVCKLRRLQLVWTAWSGFSLAILFLRLQGFWDTRSTYHTG